jgi:hypothetical protein
MSTRKREKAAACHQRTLAKLYFRHSSEPQDSFAAVEPPEFSHDPRVVREAVRNYLAIQANFATHSFEEQQRQLENRHRTRKAAK